MADSVSLTPQPSVNLVSENFKNNTQLEIPKGAEYEERQLIVKFAGGMDPAAAISSQHSISKTANKFELISESTYLVTLKSDISIEESLKVFSTDKAVLYAEPNYTVQVGATSDDPSFIDNTLWGLKSGFGSNAEGAWAQNVTGSNNVYVAVIDSGIDYTHPDLAANVWTSTTEIAGDGIDNDANGFIDDVHGFDFLNDDASVYDGVNEHPHGTHVAGTIGAVGNNATGVTGVAMQVKLISAKFINSRGEGNVSDAIQAVDYINMLRTKMGIDIIASNNSWSGPQYSEALNDAIRRGGDAGIIFVAAAGNDSQDLQMRNDFPAVYNCNTSVRAFDCMITVAATTSTGALASFSNYGSVRVDIGAPGTNIQSTMPGNTYGGMSGTSMAAPHVTGAVALCAAANRGMSAKEIRQAMFDTAAATPSLVGKTVTGGRLDAGALITQCLAGVTPSMSGASSLTRSSSIYTDRIRLDWEDTATGEFEHQIQIATGPAGCSGTFVHYAYIGPGINTYPITNLEEAQFYCLRVRAIRDGVTSAWATSSNVSITWTSNAPFITGTLTLNDGITPVANATVKWQAANVSGTTGQLTAYTDIDGKYVLQVSSGTLGKLWAGSPTSGLLPTPVIPLGLSAGGQITVTTDTLVNIKTPPQNLVTLDVKNFDGVTPIAGARIDTTSDAIFYCKDGTTYTAFSGATNKICSFYPAGDKHTPPRTGADGRITLAVPTAAVYIKNSFIFAASNPNSPSSIGQVTISPTADMTVPIITPELVTLSGVARTFTGSAVKNATAFWQATGFPNNIYSPTVTTNAAGEYSLSVPKGTPIKLGIGSARTCNGTTCTSPLIPRSLSSYGITTINGPTSKDLIAPSSNIVTITVLDEATQQPIANAKIRYAGGFERCESNIAYVPFTGATGTYCHFEPAGDKDNPAVTDSNGQLQLALPDTATFKGTYSLTATHPTQTTRVGQLSFAPSSLTAATITAPSSSVTLSGKVFQSDGLTPVKQAKVKFIIDGLPSNVGSPLITYTDDTGAYSLNVPAGNLSQFWVEGSGLHPAVAYPVGIYSNPMIPTSLVAGGKFTPTVSQTINLKLPAYSLITLNVVDAYTLAPVEGAKIVYERYVGRYCNGNSYTPFAGATTSFCSFWPVGGNDMYPLTDANGQVVIALPTTAATGLSSYTFSAIHPMTNTRVTSITFAANGDATHQMIIPGTPSIPEQPTVTAQAGQVQLSWTEPWNGGEYIDYYQVWSSLSPTGPFVLVPSGSCAGNIAPNLRTCVVENLEAGTTYYFAIIAHNVVGASGLSVAVAAAPLSSAPSTVQNNVNPPISSSPGGGGGGGAKQEVSIPKVKAKPSINGNFAAGQIIRADHGTWTNDWPLTYEYKWYRCAKPVAAGEKLPANAGCDEISGQIDMWYQLTAADLKKHITVEVTATDDSNSGTYLAAAVSAGNLKQVQIVSKPKLSGTAKVGKTLNVAGFTWGTSLRPKTVKYQWYSCANPTVAAASAPINCAPIISATKASYTINKLNKGKYLTVLVTGTNGTSSVSYSPPAKTKVG